MRKTKRLISLILVAALTLSVCLMGGIIGASAAATVIDEGNYLTFGGFETTDTVWNNSISKNGCNGFVDKQGTKGQNVVFIDGWRIMRTNEHLNAPFISHITDSVEGNFALKFRTQANGNNTIVYARTQAVLTDKIAAGYYQLSAYVKGTNTKSSLSVGVTSTESSAEAYTYSSNISASEGWQKVTVDNIYLTDGAANLATYGWDSYIETAIQLNLNADTVETELYIDNVRLEKMPMVQVDPNLVVDGGFENSSFSGYANHAQGQIPFEKGEFWAYQTWVRDTITVEDTADTHSGSLAVKISTPSTTNDWFRFWMTPKNLNTDNLVAGTYKLTAWVKGTNTDACIQELDSTGNTIVQSVNVPASAANGWTKITLDNITINSVDDLYLVGTGKGDNRYRYNKIRFHVKNAADKYVIFDDVRFEKVEETNEMLTNTSFEEFTCATDGTHKPGFGQKNVVANAWFNSEHWGKAANNNLAEITHDTDAKSGNYSLKFALPQNGAAVSLVTDTVNGDMTALSGAYIYSFWVKGDGATVAVRNRNATGSFDTVKSVTATDEWTQVSVLLPSVGYYEAEYNGQSADKRNTLSAEIRISSSSEKATYAIIDDISLMAADTIGDVKGQIMGIKQPTVGANKLELPVLDTNNPNIEVSIAATSNEGVIALDGTITTPKTQKVVDITLKISDGTNEVTLDPIGVLVHGELDTVTQPVIEKAIDDLDVKGTTAYEDMTEINYWLEYKGGVVSKASKNLYSQKKLVYTYDVESDYALDAKDIKAVRDDILGDEAQYNIRYLVTMYTKVVEYNSYN